MPPQALYCVLIFTFIFRFSFALLDFCISWHSFMVFGVGLCFQISSCVLDFPISLFESRFYFVLLDSAFFSFGTSLQFPGCIAAYKNGCSSHLWGVPTRPLRIPTPHVCEFRVNVHSLLHITRTHLDFITALTGYTRTQHSSYTKCGPVWRDLFR